MDGLHVDELHVRKIKTPYVTPALDPLRIGLVSRGLRFRRLR
jgi:hypothetical protein